MNNSELEHAIQLVKNRNYKQGGQLLIDILKKEPNNELAWLWLSACYKNPDSKIKCLRKVISINPKNETALHALQAIQSKIPDDRIEEPSLSSIVENVTEKKSKNYRTSLLIIALLSVFLIVVSLIIFQLINRNNQKTSTGPLSSSDLSIATPLIAETTIQPTIISTQTRTPKPTSTTKARPSSTPTERQFTAEFDYSTRKLDRFITLYGNAFPFPEITITGIGLIDRTTLTDNYRGTGIYAFIWLKMKSPAEGDYKSTYGAWGFYAVDANGAMREQDWVSSDCQLNTTEEVYSDGVVEGCLVFALPDTGNFKLIYAPYGRDQFAPENSITWDFVYDWQ